MTDTGYENYIINLRLYADFPYPLTLCKLLGTYLILYLCLLYSGLLLSCRIAENVNWQVAGNDSSSKSESSSFGEIIMEPQEASYDMSFGVPPAELERRLHELLETRLQERITELESALEYATQKLNEKETRSSWCEDSAIHIPYHVPETSRFTFPLDPEAALKFSQVVG